VAGVRGRSGPPGNLNNSRHPWRAFWRRRALKASDRWVLPVIESYGAGLVSDKPNPTEGEVRCIEIAQIARGASMLILAECANSGFTVKEKGTWALAPGAKELSRFLAVERSCLQTLGLGRRAQPVQSLDEYVKQRYGNREPESEPPDTSATVHDILCHPPTIITEYHDKEEPS
jgi:hypothetical protein